MNKDAIILDWLMVPENRERCPFFYVSESQFDVVSIICHKYSVPEESFYQIGGSIVRVKINRL